MARRFDEPRLVIASHNAGKLGEIAALMTPLGVTTESAAELGLDEPEETGLSFTENAVLKARAAAEATGAPALADDSGLMVAGLGGAPGIHSARWAETARGRDFAVAMARIEAMSRHIAAHYTQPLAVEEIARAARPGQFVNILPSPTSDPLLRRPFSICTADRDAGTFTALIKVVGPGTQLLTQMAP